MTTLALSMPGGWEWMILLVFGLLIFGRRLPEVGRAMGQGIVEFKRGIKGIQDEVEDESSRPGSKKETKPLPDRGASVEPPRSAEGSEVRVSRADAVE